MLSKTLNKTHLQAYYERMVSCAKYYRKHGKEALANECARYATHAMQQLAKMR